MIHDIKKIKLIVSDFDGVLTDGKLFVTSRGESLFCYNAKDIIGFNILGFSDIRSVIITGNNSTLIHNSFKNVVDGIYLNVRNKLHRLKIILSSMNLEFENVAYIGDDWNDFLAMKNCYKICPNNVSDLFSKEMDFICKNRAGEGVAREAIEHILNQKGDYNNVMELYFKAKS